MAVLIRGLIVAALGALLLPAGRLVSRNKMYDRRPGRLASVPLRALKP